MQTELFGDPAKFARGWLVESDPGDPVGGLTRLIHLVQGALDLDALAVDIDGAIDNHRSPLAPPSHSSTAYAPNWLVVIPGIDDVNASTPPLTISHDL